MPEDRSPDSPPEGMPLAFAVFNEIGIIGQLSRAAFEGVLPDGVLLPHFSVLNHLIRVQDGQTPLVLAQAFQVPKTTMSHTLLGLDRHGFVELRANPSDGRSKCVWITPEGRAFRAQAIKQAEAAFAPILKALPEGSLEGLMPGLAALRKTLDKARDP